MENRDEQSHLVNPGGIRQVFAVFSVFQKRKSII